MKTIRLCSGCGTPLSADAPAALCPQCLLRSGIHTEVEDTGGVATRIPVPGETFGPYRILRLLGHGGMGRVFEAEHAETGRRVALKVMGKALASDQDRKRFLREGRLAASVNHPNVVYIHGSEEIDGVPIIAMELVHGGTLKDRIKQGPLPIAEAVEAALQIIDGLEAANAAGVLHRDIKPANCFIASDGSVKVGDFGLSVSTLARGESLLTAAGAVMGTPAYASPEQLRGEELDVRSDIYSVGATLYHLLTGNTPFGATDFVKLITEVLDKEPANPRALRSDVPSELARVVLRCLAKDCKGRFQTYAELRDALLPFRTSEVTPAKPAMRFLATVVDDLIAYMPSFLFLTYWSYDPLDHFTQTRTLTAFMLWLSFYGGYVLYYAISEGLWGAGLGKTLCGLRVVNEHREAPGVARAALRVVIYAIPFTVPSLVYMTITSAEEVRAALLHGDFRSTDWVWLPLTVLLFVTARARNGYAAIQDLVSRTRVIVRPKTQPRPTLAWSAPEKAAMTSLADAPRTFGPYEVASTLWKTTDAELAMGFDPTLRRKVWIHLTKAASIVDEARRDLSRATRLRWLDSGTAHGVFWNAYEALDGAALLAIAQQPQRWNAVRFWLLDVSEECSAATQDLNTSPVLQMDRLWITATGRAVLLEFTAPGLVTATATAAVDCTDGKAVQAFLTSMAKIALSQDRVAQAGDAPVNALIPLHARQILSSISRGAFEEVRYVVGNLRSLISKPAEVTTSRRAAAIFFVPAVAFAMAVAFAAIVMFERVRWDRVWTATYPGKPSLRIPAEIYVDQLQKDDLASRKNSDFDSKELDLIGIYLAKHFAHVLTNEAFWTLQPNLTFVPEMRERLREVVAQYSNPNSRKLAEAERLLSKRIARFEHSQRLAFLPIVAVTATGFLVLMAFTDLVSILGFRTALVLRLFGIGVVNRAGARASRGRLLWRCTVVWGPLIIATSIIAFLAGALTRSDANLSLGINLALLLTLIAAIVAVMIYAVRRPSAGLHDRIAGTRLVPM